MRVKETRILTRESKEGRRGTGGLRAKRGGEEEGRGTRDEGRGKLTNDRSRGR